MSSSISGVRKRLHKQKKRGTAAAPPFFIGSSRLSSALEAHRGVHGEPFRPISRGAMFVERVDIGNRPEHGVVGGVRQVGPRRPSASISRARATRKHSTDGKPPEKAEFWGSQIGPADET